MQKIQPLLWQNRQAGSNKNFERPQRARGTYSSNHSETVQTTEARWRLLLNGRKMSNSRVTRHPLRLMQNKGYCKPQPNVPRGMVTKKQDGSMGSIWGGSAGATSSLLRKEEEKMMCEFTEEEACNCISALGESEIRNVVLETLPLFLLTHLTIPKRPSVWRAAKLSGWNDWRGAIFRTKTESAELAFSWVSRAQLGPYHRHRQLFARLNSLS